MISEHQKVTADANHLRVKQVVEAARFITEDFKRMLHCCPNCWNYDPELDLCKLANARPPTLIIAFGCEKFDFDIPF